MNSPAAILTQSRFVFVDGLRGLAALSIVIFHIWWYEPAPYPALESAHWIFDEAFLRIRAGVQILLVISGFVIAYTLRNTWVTPTEVISFIGRRLVRLIPTYWVAIIIVILVDGACRHLLNLASPVEGEMSLTRVSAHMTFLQDVLGHEALSAGMWTVSIEVQFYIVAILGWGAAQRLFPRPVASEPRPSMLGLMTVFAPAAIVCLFYWRAVPETSPWMIHFLWMFFIGMATWWALDRTISISVFMLIMATGVLDLIFDARVRIEVWNAIFSNSTLATADIESWRYENSIALLTAFAIFLAGIRDKLHTWLNWRWLQFLGKISYSLYLVHFPVCHLLTTVGWNFCQNSPNPIQAASILMVCVPASILAAHFLYLLVESPSAGWAAKMKNMRKLH